jgi:hypothetical protein
MIQTFPPENNTPVNIFSWVAVAIPAEKIRGALLLKSFAFVLFSASKIGKFYRYK